MTNLISRGVKRIKNKGFNDFFRATYGYLHIEPIVEMVTMPLIINFAKRDFIRKAANQRTIDELVDFAMNYHFLTISIRPGQTRKEIVDFLNMTSKIKPKAIMEIGTDKGGTLFLFSRIADKDATIISVSYQFEQVYKICSRQRLKLFVTFPTGNQKLKIINRNSHDRETLLDVKRALSGRKLDMLFIDADHTYEGVKLDYTMYAPLVRKGGIIAFHDITGSKNNPTTKYWNELSRSRKESIEFRVPGGFGIGVVIR